MNTESKIIFFPSAPPGTETEAQRDARLGRLHLMKGEWDMGVSYLTAAVVLEPENARYWRDLGRALAGAGDSRLARDAWLAGVFWATESEEVALVAELETLIAT